MKARNLADQRKKEEVAAEKRWLPWKKKGAARSSIIRVVTDGENRVGRLDSEKKVIACLGVVELSRAS